MAEVIGNIIGALVIIFMIAMVVCAFAGLYWFYKEGFKDND